MALSRPNTMKVLQTAALFAPLDESEMQVLAGRTGARSFSAGELLFSEGDACEGLYMVATGKVRIFKVSSSGREHVLSLEGPGASIAELPVFDGGTYPASASAVDASEMLFISRKDLRSICLEHPEIALKLLQVVGARLRRLVGIIEELSFTTVRHRLISWILRRARAECKPGDPEPAISMNTTHQELAAQIGTVRELVSRNMARLQAQGFIEIGDHRLKVIDMEGLEADLNSVV